MNKLKKGKTALVVAAHPDDEVLGCGATIRLMVNKGWKCHLAIMTNGVGGRYTDSENTKIADEQRELAKQATKAAELIGFSSIEFGDFPDNRMDTVSRADLTHWVRAQIEDKRPHTVFTHHPGDYNWDHTLTFEAVMMGARPNPPEFCPSEIRTFEVLSSTERAWQSESRAFHPNLFIDVEDTIEVKKEALKAYEMEYRAYPHPRNEQSIEYLARKRGNEIGINYAEAFHIIRKLEC